MYKCVVCGELRSKGLVRNYLGEWYCFYKDSAYNLNSCFFKKFDLIATPRILYLQCPFCNNKQEFEIYDSCKCGAVVIPSELGGFREEKGYEFIREKIKWLEDCDDLEVQDYMGECENDNAE